jgi:trehalose 6-phosphate synthase
MRAMRRTVMQHDVSAWARSFLDELAATRPAHDKTVQPASRS